MTRFALPALLGATLLCAWPTALPAQNPDACSYDACALRLRYRLLGGEIVQGRDERRAVSLGWLAPAAPLFAERSDTAAWYYGSFRRRQHVGAVLGLIGIAASAAAVFVGDSDEGLSTGLGIGGGVVLFGAGVQIGRAQNQLSKAVWWYNRTLEPSGEIVESRP